MIPQLLIAASFVLASIQDVRERAVHDLVWIPAVIGGILAVSSQYPSLVFPLAKVGLIGAIAFAFVFFGLVGEADGIALALISTDPGQFSPIFPLFGAAAIALCHIGYEFSVGNARGTPTVPLEKFLQEQRWIPKAIVDGEARTEVTGDVNDARDEVQAKAKPGSSVVVSYGVPTVAYLGAGYVAYLVLMLILRQAPLVSFP